MKKLIAPVLAALALTVILAGPGSASPRMVVGEMFTNTS
jgi:hypothetical protein